MAKGTKHMRSHVHALRHTLCCLTFLRLGSGTFGSPTELQPQQPTGVQQSSPFRLQRQQPTGAQQSSLTKLRNLAYALPVVGTLLLVSLMHRPFGGHHDRWRQPERKLGGKVPPPSMVSRMEPLPVQEVAKGIQPVAEHDRVLSFPDSHCVGTDAAGYSALDV